MLLQNFNESAAIKCFTNALFQNWRRTLLSIFIGALLIRGVFILTLQDGFYFPDSIDYSKAAISLITNGELGKAYNRPPGYPVFLAGIYMIFGESIFAIRMVESVMGALLAVVIALIGKRIGGEVVGALAGILWTIYPIGVFIAGLVYPTNIFTMLLACGVLCLLPYPQQELSPKRVFLAGVLWGLAALIVPIVLVTIGTTSLWLILRGQVKRLVLVSLLFLGSALTIVPWTIRDYYVYDQIVAVEPRVVQHLPRMLIAPENVRENKVDAILRHPGLFAAHFGSEFLHFWRLSPDRIQMNNQSYREKEHEKDGRVIEKTIFSTGNLINAVSILSTGPLFFFAIIGTAAMWFQQERRRELWLLWATILSVAVGYSIFYTKTRYRIPIEPYIVILSAYGLRKTWRLIAIRFGYGRSKVKLEVGVGAVRG
jgi:4-amino-4-deoxy-L-arabinose transferase-like glycosyltransferase